MSTSRDFEVEEKLIGKLRRRKGVATVGDMVADTGLPADEVESGLRRMLGIYQSHLDVDDAGNLRYRFDPKFVRYGNEPSRVWFKIWRAVKQAAALLFKIWIVLMIVGYTAAFVLLLLGASLGALGLTLASGDDGGGGMGELGFLPLYAMVRVLEFMFWISLFDDSRGFMGRRMKRRRKKPEKPFYRKVFDYVFGPKEARPDPLAAQQFFASLVRSHDGVLTSADWAKHTGHSLSQARNLLTACALRFRGEVEMADDGTLLFRFPELNLSAAGAAGTRGAAGRPPTKRSVGPVWNDVYVPAPLTGNKRSTNVWISILNGFNLTMGGVVLFALPATISAAAATALGLIPVTFSALLFSVPIVRRVRRGNAKKLADQENAWRTLMERVFAAAEEGAALPVGEVPSNLQARLMTELSAESETAEDGTVSFRFPQLSAELAASRAARAATDPGSASFGTSIFSTDDDSAAMDEKDEAEFDARLQRELAG